MNAHAIHSVVCAMAGFFAILLAPVVVSSQPPPAVRDHRAKPEVRDHRGTANPALQAALAKAVNAAANGPEIKKLNVGGHEFNVKKAAVTGTSRDTTIAGQISHHLTARPDDQVYYTIKKSSGRVQSVEIKIARGGLTRYVSYASRLANSYVNTAIPAAQIESFLRELGRSVEGSWESSADLIVAAIALNFNPWRPPDGTPPPRGPTVSTTERPRSAGR